MLRIQIARANWRKVLAAIAVFDDRHPELASTTGPILWGENLCILPEDTVEFFSILLG